MPGNDSQDTIPVRPDEQLDEAKLAAYLRGRLPGSELDKPPMVRQFGGGKANLTYLLDYGANCYVLRRPPLGPVAPSAHDMAREFKVLSRLYQAFPLAPRAFLFCQDMDILGAPFFVMERREGVVVRTQMPPAYTAMPQAARRLSEALVDTLVDFHAVDYAALGLETLGKPDGYVARQVEGWYRRWQQAKVVETPSMEAVYYWLRANLPAFPPPPPWYTTITNWTTSCFPPPIQGSRWLYLTGICAPWAIPCWIWAGCWLTGPNPTIPLT
ncbi:MAG: hypothetical protein Fur0021_10340 [Candidatus Promineifilaceae bacterium]